MRLVHRLVNESGVNEDLSDANFRDVDLNGVDLSNANLNGVMFQGTIINDETKLDDKWRLVHRLVNEDAVNKKFIRLDLSGANFGGVDFTGVNFEGTNLKHADFRWATFWASDIKDDELAQAMERAKQMIQSAENWEYAKYSRNICALLELPHKVVKQKKV